MPPTTLAVIIPCYRVGPQILSVLNRIGPEVNKVFIVDDGCPLGTGEIVNRSGLSLPLEVIFHETNRGVGAAVKTGYERAVAGNFGIIVKLDGDGQMDPSLIPALIAPMVAGQADYVKGNRFHSNESSKSMPRIRHFGNKLFTKMCRIASGQNAVHDVLNGFTAISRTTLERLNLSEIADDYFFESDMIIALARIGACLKELPMQAVYGSEVSSLSVMKTLLSFPPRYLRAWLRRLTS